MPNDYSIFTKSELADYLQKYEKAFLYTELPYDALLDARLNEINRKIDENLKRGEVLTTKWAETKTIDMLAEVVKNHDKWKKLNAEYEKISKMRFPKSKED